MKKLKKNIVEVFITLGLLFLIYNISVIPTQNSNTQASGLEKISVPLSDQVTVATRNSATLKDE